MRIEPSLENPTLYYKLDPGEMGLAVPAKASESILRVTAHEIANIRRFEAEAALEGGVVIYKKVSLDLAFEGSFLAARAGKSEAKIIYKRKGNYVVLEEIGKQRGDKLRLRLERDKEILESKKNAIIKDPSLDPTQKEFKVENINRKIREIERLIGLLEAGINLPFNAAVFLNLLA